MFKPTSSFTFALLAMLPFATTALADRVYLKNGDVITGDIVKIWSNKLTFDPSYAGKIEISLSDIAYLESDSTYKLELVDGVKSEGSLQGKDNSGNQIVALAGGETRTLPLEQLTELKKPETYYDWSHRVSANGELNRGNTKSDKYSVRYNSKLKLGKHRHLLDVYFDRETQEEVDTKEQDRVNYGYNWTFKEPWFLGVNAAYERDPIKDLTYRYSLLPGLGYEIWNDAWRFFTVEAGVGYRREKISGEESDSATAGWTVRFSHDLKGGDMEIFHNHSLYSNINGRDNTVFNSSSGLIFNVLDNIDVSVSVDYDKESHPSGGANESDTTVLFGVGYDF